MSFLRRFCLNLTALFLILILFAPLSAQAAQKKGTITECVLTSGGKIRLKAELKDAAAHKNDRCYLLALPFSGGSVKKGENVLASGKYKEKITLSISSKKIPGDDLFYTRFVFAVRSSDGSYRAVTKPVFPTNPGKKAAYRYSFPKTISKKGLAVSSTMPEDAVDLNIQHSTINIVFTELLATDAEKNSAASIPFTYHNKTYWFRRAAVGAYDAQLGSLAENGAVNTAILLLGYRNDLIWLIAPKGREPGHNFYAWNVTSRAARETFQACLSFLARRYSAKNSENGRIVNWIIGNEVNNYQAWNYGGNLSLSSYASLYSSAFRMAYNTITSVYSKARVYISLDHLWNSVASPRYFTARKMLDTFASSIKAHGSIPWNLAYHPYSSPLTEPKFWENANRQLTGSITSPVINMGNIQILTDYIRKKYGSSTRIILSEQGYTSVRYGQDAQADQAAAIAYSYYITESNDMIDSFIMNRQVDHIVEEQQGLNLGLWTNNSTEWAASKKQSWNVYKYIDTNQSLKVSKQYLPIIGASNWKELISGFSASLYNKQNIVSGKLTKVSGYTKKAGIPADWAAYGAVRSRNTAQNGWQTLHLDNANPNRSWGFTQSFSRKLSFSKYPSFCATVRVTGAAAGKVHMRIVFYSGKNRFECSADIPAGKEIRLKTSLKKWKYRNKVTKIKVLASPVSNGWKPDSAMTLTNVVRGS